MMMMMMMMMMMIITIITKSGSLDDAIQDFGLAIMGYGPSYTMFYKYPKCTHQNYKVYQTKTVTPQVHVGYEMIIANSLAIYHLISNTCSLNN